jgi:hypothetical protein
MRLPRCSPKWLLPLVLVMLGCQPEIGDACNLHTDCSSSGDRLCDPTMKGGYCTIFNCEPGGCPEEAVCVAYQTVASTEAECRDPASGARLVRTFCMRSCSSDGDCRSGYSCIDLSDGNPWGAEVVETGSRTRKICTIPASIPTDPAEPGDPDRRETEVCNPPQDASFPPVITLDGEAPSPPDASDGGPADGAAGAPAEAGAGGRDASVPDASDASLGSGGTASGAGGAAGSDAGPGGAGGAAGRDAASAAANDG